MQNAIAKAVEGNHLDAVLMEQVMEKILAGQASNAQIAGLLVALRAKGETVEELAAGAKIMRKYCHKVEIPTDDVVLDTCGTGGDGTGTFNISTVAAIVACACGVTVAKHGNRAASSTSGSADVLEALGIKIDLPPTGVADCLRNLGIGFMFARTHHPAMKYAAPVRSELGIRTLFNLLGPLTNPAGASHQLLGVYDRLRVEQIAHVLSKLGSRRAWVVHGNDGLDEVSPTDTTLVAQWSNGQVTSFEVTPEDFGIARVSLASLKGGDAKENAAITNSVLSGKKSPYRDAVVINASAALCVAEVAESPIQGAALAAEAIDTGAARKKLDQWIERSRVE